MVKEVGRYLSSMDVNSDLPTPNAGSWVVFFRPRAGSWPTLGNIQKATILCSCSGGAGVIEEHGKKGHREVGNLASLV